MALKEKNQIPLTSEFLLVVLSDLDSRIAQYFGSLAPVNLVIHGGAVMVLHAGLGLRHFTLDIDYCHRAFVTEWQSRGLMDADVRLRKCIAATAERFDLGADWMNAHADVALPHHKDPRSGQVVDHVWRAAMEKPNVQLNTVYKSPHLTLIGVPWSWGVALKLTRYKKHDPFDIACILTLGQSNGVKRWSLEILEQWLLSLCGVMGYAHYPPQQMQQTRDRMQHAIRYAKTIEQQGKLKAMEAYQKQLAIASMPPQMQTQVPMHAQLMQPQRSVRAW